MAHLQYIPGDPRLVDQLVYELKSKGIFDQFRKDCIADVDTRPAYQNLRQRVENSVSTFLARQCWKPDLNKNQLREKLRKHILDGNYLEQGVERIVDQVVNPKVASVFIPQVEDLVYNYLGITRKKSAPAPETSNGNVNDNGLLPTDLEAVSPGSVKSHNDKNDAMDVSLDGMDNKMEIDQEDKPKEESKVDSNTVIDVDKLKSDTRMSGLSEVTSNDSSSIDKSTIPLPDEEIKLENIPEPENSPPKTTDMKVELEKIQLPDSAIDIPLPEEVFKPNKEHYFKPINSEDDDSSSDSSLRRNMSPLTPIRNFNNENSCDAQQAFENESVDSRIDKKEVLEPNTFRFTIETKTENSSDVIKPEKKDTDQTNLSYQFNSQVNLNTFNTPMYDDSSNSNLLQIDYESDANSKLNIENKIPEPDQNSDELRKDKKHDERKSSHKSSHRDKDSNRHSSSKDRRTDSKQSSSRDAKSDRKSSKDDSSKSTSKSSHKERSSDRSDRKDSRDSSKHRSSHKSSSNKDSKSHKSSSSSQRYSSSSKNSDERKPSSSSKDKEKSSKDDRYSKEKFSKDSKTSSSSNRSDKDRKSSSSSKNKHDVKDKKKEKKEIDDHYSASGRGSHSRRSTDRDSNDGSSSSKGSHNPSNAKSSETKKENKSSTSKSDNISTSADSTSPSDKDLLVNELKKSHNAKVPQNKPVIRVENHLEMPIASPPRLPFVPDITLKKPRIAANLQEAKKLMKMRKFLDEEQKRMNQEAALLLEFQANVRPSLSQVYSNIPGPELEFACVTATSPEVIVDESKVQSKPVNDTQVDNIEARSDSISDILNAAEQVENIEVTTDIKTDKNTESVFGETEIDAEVNETHGKATVHIEQELTNENLVQVENAVLKECQDMDLTNSNLDTSENINSTENSMKSIVTINDSSVLNEDTTRKATENIEPKDIESDDIEGRLQKLLEGKESMISFEVSIEIEELPENNKKKLSDAVTHSSEDELEYFAEHEKYTAELERDKFSKFLKEFTEKYVDKMYLINCDSYGENILKEVLQGFGTFEIVNYYKNGHLKLNNTAKNVVRNLNVSSEVSLPVETKSPSLMFSPVKSECSFELSSDYNAKLEEMVSKTSRKEIMEIILGSVEEESANDVEMPTIDYCNESNIESDSENALKRKICEVESSENNNRKVLTPSKIRRLSESDQITSTTQETEETSQNNMTLNSSTVRSKYLGRARRVGLPRPRRSNLSNSPSSDKSIENYEQNTPVNTSNCKIKTLRNKVQRYDTSDLYKPKLHYLSRRNNIS